MIVKGTSLFSDCTPGEFDYIRKAHPSLVEKLASHLVVHNEPPQQPFTSLPIVFIFTGTDRQRDYWLRDKDIDPKHIRLITDYQRLQGMRARVLQVELDPFWAPMGPDERYAAAQSDWYIRDLRSRYGDLWDVVRTLHPEDEKKWIRLA
ncbi:hypothetical protein SEA_GIANTSBANE_86 [Arthrobacter phage Giantsbane]|nr:hypothetical protein SEA_GIANTSBANE_86 [Arthrobacter phage Giantsbane]